MRKDEACESIIDDFGPASPEGQHVVLLHRELAESKRLLHLAGRRLGKLGLKIGKLASENERMRKILNRYEALDIELDLTRVVPAGWFDRFRAAGNLRKKERRTHCPCNHNEPSECHSKDEHARFETRKNTDERSKGLPYDRPRWPAKKMRL